MLEVRAGMRPMGPSSHRNSGRTGQGIVEYGLMLGLTSVLTVVILVFFGGTVAQVLAVVGGLIDKAG
jgi:Flp pilus assembly pilin Flp